MTDRVAIIILVLAAVVAVSASYGFALWGEPQSAWLWGMD